MLNYDAVKVSPLRRRRVEIVKRTSYRIRSPRRRALRAACVLFAVAALAVVGSGLEREGMLLTTIAVLVGAWS